MKTSGPGVAQRLMSSRIVPRIYERWWRPAIGWAAKGCRGPTMAGEVRLARALLEPVPGAIVVDVACGPGTFARALAQDVGGTGMVIGVDVSATMLAQASRDTGAPQVVYVRADATTLPLRPGSADAVCCFGALHLFSDPGRALERMTETLVPDGRLALLTTVRPRSVPGRLAVATFCRLTGMRAFDAGLLSGELSARGLDVTYRRRLGLLQVIGARRTVSHAQAVPPVSSEQHREQRPSDQRKGAEMVDEERRSETARRLDEEDPLDRIEPDEVDQEDVERAWEETDVESGEAPTG